MRHVKQIAYLDDGRRKKFVLAGRRGGKTAGFREELLEKTHTCPPGGKVFYIGPTNPDAKELIWDDLEMRLHELKWKNKPLPSKSYFRLSKGRKIYVIGAEKIRKVRGHKAWHITCDELAYYSVPVNKIWQAIRPALTDLGGSCSMGTTPDSKGSPTYKFWKARLHNPQWGFHSWKTLENPFINPKELEDAARDMDPRAFNVEYNAVWEAYEGLAYYCYDELIHLKPCRDFVDSAPYDMMLDFNVNPTTVLVGQMVPSEGIEHAYVRREYSSQGATWQTVELFCLEFQHKAKDILVRVFGDASGHNRSSTTGYAEYYYVKKVLEKYGFNYIMRVPGANPPVVDRVSHVNAWCKNVKGESRTTIDPSCVELDEDLSSQELDGRHPDDKNNLGHKADAFGYYINWLHHNLTRKPSGTVQL